MINGMLIWLDNGLAPMHRTQVAVATLKPLAVAFEEGDLRELVCRRYDPALRKGDVWPYTVVGTGTGTAVFGIAEITAMRHAFCNPTWT